MFYCHVPVEIFLNVFALTLRHLSNEKVPTNPVLYYVLNFTTTGQSCHEMSHLSRQCLKKKKYPLYKVILSICFFSNLDVRIGILVSIFWNLHLKSNFIIHQ